MAVKLTDTSASVKTPPGWRGELPRFPVCLGAVRGLRQETQRPELPMPGRHAKRRFGWPCLACRTHAIRPGLPFERVEFLFSSHAGWRAICRDKSYGKQPGPGTRPSRPQHQPKRTAASRPTETEATDGRPGCRQSLVVRLPAWSADPTRSTARSWPDCCRACEWAHPHVAARRMSFLLGTVDLAERASAT